MLGLVFFGQNRQEKHFPWLLSKFGRNYTSHSRDFHYWVHSSTSPAILKVLNRASWKTWKIENFKTCLWNFWLFGKVLVGFPKPPRTTSNRFWKLKVRMLSFEIFDFCENLVFPSSRLKIMVKCGPHNKLSHISRMVGIVSAKFSESSRNTLYLTNLANKRIT